MIREDELIGQTFNRWLVIERVEDIKKHKYYLCKCECGTIKKICRTNLVSEKSKSCGCLSSETTRDRNSKENRYEFYENFMIGYDSQNRSFIIDTEDFSEVQKLYWVQNSLGYFVANIPNTNRKKILLHRYIMKPTDPKIEIDHINHKVNDNRKMNLRFATHQQNLSNLKLNSKNKTGIKGISKIRDKFIAYGVCKYIRYHLGTFETLEEAKIARQEWEIKFQKEFANNNIKMVSI